MAIHSLSRSPLHLRCAQLAPLPPRAALTTLTRGALHSPLASPHTAPPARSPAHPCDPTTRTRMGRGGSGTCRPTPLPPRSRRLPPSVSAPRLPCVCAGGAVGECAAGADAALCVYAFPSCNEQGGCCRTAVNHMEMLFLLPAYSLVQALHPETSEAQGALGVQADGRRGI